MFLMELVVLLRWPTIEHWSAECIRVPVHPGPLALASLTFAGVLLLDLAGIAGT